MQPIYIQRVLNTAKLPGIKGSPEARENISDKLCAKFSQMVDDKFKKQGFVTKEELKGFFKTLAPNVDSNIWGSFRGVLRYNFTDNTYGTINGYILEIPLTDYKNSSIKKNDYENIRNLRHESKHFFKHIVEPKYSVSITKRKLPAYFHGEKLYEKYLYENELKNIPIFKRFYLKTNKTARINFVKNKINDFFIKNTFSSEEKIDILRIWKCGLRDELSAYKSEVTKKVKVKPWQKKFESHFFFSEKIKIVEKMLAEEMAKAGHDVKCWSIKNNQNVK